MKSLRPLTETLSSVKGDEENNGDEDGEGEAIFDDQYIDDDTISENSMTEKCLQAVGDTTIEDEIMMNSMTRLSLENKENPLSMVKTKNRRSSAQSNIGGLGPLGSLNV